MNNWKKTLLLRYFALKKIPMILFSRPSVHILDHQSCEIDIPLRRRTQNHLHAMYIGTLIIGSDLAAGLLAMELIAKSKHRISLVFKDVHADFLKRVDGDARFICRDGIMISELIEKVAETGERQHETINVDVIAPEKYGDEVLAKVSLTLSLKEKTQS